MCIFQRRRSFKNTFWILCVAFSSLLFLSSFIKIYKHEFPVAIYLVLRWDISEHKELLDTMDNKKSFMRTMFAWSQKLYNFFCYFILLPSTKKWEKKISFRMELLNITAAFIRFASRNTFSFNQLLLNPSKIIIKAYHHYYAYAGHYYWVTHTIN